ncbi:MAG: DUF4139 domain-containing protein [Deltaproteobacteria bacterium]|nr:DUF4139 domain-containing protein [Deltaproteobacteria bacterium]
MRRSTLRRLLSLGALWATLGCARSASVTTEGTLPLRRVVIYRNGIGYFERHGHVDEDEVRFRVQQQEVGDFLATLAVMERGGSSVRAAAFPLPEEQAGDEPPRPTERRTVRVALDGRGHDLVVGYTVETPIWRPSYRLIFDAQGHPQVQAWGIVQNLSGEDWTDVSLALVAGTPVSFRSELAEPTIPPRPVVTDRGAVIDAVPLGETVLGQDGTVTTAPSSGPAGDDNRNRESEESGADDSGDGSFADLGTVGGLPGGGGGAGGGRRTMTRRPARMAPTGAPPSPQPRGPGYSRQNERQRALQAQAERRAQTATATPRNVASLAALAVQGGTTRYDLPHRVTLPDRSATMVMLTAREVPGEQLYLFAPDPGVPESSRHPFHVARFENRTGAMLERGPVAIFEAGAYLGQGMLEPLPDGASATVPFSLERALAVETHSTYNVEGERMVRIARETITLERYNVTRTTYRGRNGMDHPLRMMMRQALGDGVQLFEPPEGTQNANGAALAPLLVPARGNAELVLTARSPFTLSVAWSNENALHAVEEWLRTANPPAPVATAVRTAAELQRQLLALGRERSTAEQRRNDLQTNAEETRENLRAIRLNPGAADLRAQLTARLTRVSAEIDTLTRQVVTLDTQLGERRVRFAETVRELEVTAAPRPPAPATPPAAPAATP